MQFLKKLLGFGDQMFQSDEDKLKNVQKVADAIKQMLPDGNVAQKGDNEVVVRGTFEGRPVSVEIDITFGGLEIAMKSGCSQPSARMRLAHDSKGATGKIAGATQEPDDFGNVKVFVAPTIYLEGERAEVDSWQGLLMKLPAPLFASLLAHLQATQGSIIFGANEIEVRPWKGDVAEGKAVDQVRGHLMMAAQLAQATEAAWR